LSGCATLSVWVNALSDSLLSNLGADLAASATVTVDIIQYSLSGKVEDVCPTAYALPQRVNVDLFGDLPERCVIVRGVLCDEVADPVADLEIAHDSQ
jgi:hypothetical protein